MFDRAGSLMRLRRVRFVVEKMYTILVSGSKAPPSQFAPPVAAGSISVPALPPVARHDRRREDRPDLVEAHDAHGLGLNLWRPVDAHRLQTRPAARTPRAWSGTAAWRYHSSGTCLFRLAARRSAIRARPSCDRRCTAIPASTAPATALIAPLTVISIRMGGEGKSQSQMS